MNNWRDDSETLCFCRNVPAGVVRDAVRSGRLKDAESVARACRAGTGCKSCLPDIATVIQQEAEARPSWTARVLKALRGRRP